MKMYSAAMAASAATLFTLLLLLPTGVVQDKQAPGIPGEKTYELLVEGAWRGVPETVWDRCGMFEQLPACMLSDAD
jgi:hypothetical protein